MIDLVFILLMQSAAGDPAPTQPVQIQATSGAPVEQPQTVSPDTTVVLAPDSEAREGLQCERVRATGSRVRRETVCTTAQTRSETRETANTLANSGGRAQRGQ